MNSPLLDRYRAMPRALRWAVLALAGVLVYLVILDPYVVGKASQLHSRASDTSTKLVTLNKQAESTQWHNAVTSVQKFGDAAMADIDSTDAGTTGGGEDSRLAFDRRITSIMKAHEIASYAAPRRPMAMGDGPLKRAINPQTEQIDRSQAEIKFDANPEKFADILADLEKAPEVSAISEVEVRKADRDASSRTLSITIRAETWSIIRKEGAPMNQAVHQVYRRLGGPGLAAVAAGAVALIVLVVMLKLLVGTLFLPSATRVQQADKERQDNAKQFAAAFEGRLAQINGRSLWFIPSAPIPPPPPPPPETPHIATTPPPPSTYGGPALIAMVNGVVWFADGKKLGAGEGDSDLKVVELRAPWGALVKWKDIQFTVGLFDRDSVIYPQPKEKEAKSDPADALMGPEAPPEALTEESKPVDPKPAPAEAPAPPRGETESEAPRPPNSIESR